MERKEHQDGRDPSGSGSREPDPSVPALTGFDPSRVSRVVTCGGTTEIYFEGGVLTSFSDPGVFRIHASSGAWFFEWSDRFGALRVGPKGETREQPAWSSKFWHATALWARQGKRTEEIGRRLVAQWHEPPPATHYWVRRGRQRLVIRSEEPEGYDSTYSKEIFIECDSDGSPKGGDACGSVEDDSAAIAQKDSPNASL